METLVLTSNLQPNQISESFGICDYSSKTLHNLDLGKIWTDLILASGATRTARRGLAGQLALRLENAVLHQLHIGAGT